MKQYSYADQEYMNVLTRLVETEDEFRHLRDAGTRFAMLVVTDTDSDGIVGPAFPDLPYIVKINNIKDRILQNKDVVIYLDYEFLDQCIEDAEVEALIYSALSVIEPVYKKEEIVVESDGRIKLRVKKPDMSFAGYSRMVDKFGINSCEMKLYNKLIADNAEAFNKGE